MSKKIENLADLIDDNDIDYLSYSTDYLKYSTWLDKLCKKTKLSIFYVLLIINCFLFLMGLMVSFSINFQENYIKSIPIYFAFAGIFLSGLTIRYASVSVHTIFEDLRPCFMISDVKYLNYLNFWFRKASNNKFNFLVGFLFFLFVLVIILIVYKAPLFLNEFHLNSLKPKLLLEQKWYSEDYLNVKSFILILYALFCSIFLGTSARLLLLGILLLTKLVKMPVIPIPNLIRIRLEKLSNLYILISVTWFLGVALISFLFFENLDFISVLLIASLGILGMFFFIIPQIVYRILLAKSVHMASQWILTSFYKNFNIRLSERGFVDLSKTDVVDKLTNFEDLSSFSEASTPSNYWIYDPTEILFFVGSQTLGYLIVFFKH